MPTTTKRKPRQIKIGPWWDGIDEPDFGSAYLGDDVWLSDIADPSEGQKILVEIARQPTKINIKYGFDDWHTDAQGEPQRNGLVTLFRNVDDPSHLAVEVTVYDGRKIAHREVVEHFTAIEAEDGIMTVGTEEDLPYGTWQMLRECGYKIVDRTAKYRLLSLHATSLLHELRKLADRVEQIVLEDGSTPDTMDARAAIARATGERI